MQGFLNLNKPAGFTSHDCVAKLRRILRLKRIGHAGTLDPAATGVLPVALGKATRLLQFLRDDKAYCAIIRLGIVTTTDDLEGEIISAVPVEDLSLEVVTNHLEKFLGKIQQIPPNYSAIQVGGKRLYDLARKGEKIEVPARNVEVHNIDILDWRPGEFPEIDLAISCGPGTYIRSIARDLGSVLNTGGTLARLIRTESSGFYLSDSLTFEQVEDFCQQGCFEPLSPISALQHLPAIILPPVLARRWCQGQKIFEGFSFENLGENTENINHIVRVHDESDILLGISRVDVVNESDVFLAPEVVLESI